MRIPLFLGVTGLALAFTLLVAVDVQRAQPQFASPMIASLPLPPCISGLLGCKPKLKNPPCIPNYLGCPRK